MSTHSRLSRALRHLRGLRALLLVVLSCGALLGVGAVPAAAKIAHKSEGSFSGSETPGGSFGYLIALSVDNSTGPSAGDVYVGGLSFSTFSGYVYKFDANGKYTGVELNGSETPGGSFAFISPSTGKGSRGLAVDSSSGANKGDIYVADAAHQVIDRFSEAGKFLCEISGREYASLSSAEQAAECAGSAGSKTPQGGFTEGGYSEAVLGVAVNPVNGDVYASDPGHAVVDEFNEAGKYIGQISDSHIPVPGPLAFSSAGELYVDNGGFTSPAEVAKFDASGIFAAVLDRGPAGYVAVNPSSDSVFVADTDGNFFGGENETAEYDSSGSLNSKFGQRESGAIGVSASTGRIYLGPLASGSVSMYGPAVVIPDVTTTAASEVAQFTATLNGEVNPAGGGNVESCEFEYGTTTSYGQTAPCSPTTPYAGVTSVSASLSALSPETTYHFRVKASNSNGVASYSSDQTFTTPAASVTGHATNVTDKSATLGGTVDPDGTTITDCHFEYGTTASYGQSKPCASTPSGSSPVAVSADITGLSENTTYHFRLVAANSGGSYPGLDETFTTLSRPVIATAYTSKLTESSVDLNAEINPKEFDTTYHFEWGTGTSYGNSMPVPDADIGSGSSDVPVSQHVSGLAANTTYHWRVVATNSIGTRDGVDHTFIYQTNPPVGAGCSNEQLRVANALSLLLPDCRAYEQVSPVDKNESDVKNAFEGGMYQQASVNGERILYESLGAFPGSPNGGLYVQYLASRGASGWSTRAVDLPKTSTISEGGDLYGVLPLSADLSTGLISVEQALVAGAPMGSLYVGNLLTGSYQLVTEAEERELVAPSNNLIPAVFAANGNLYEWVEGQRHLINLIPTSGTSCTGAQCTPAPGAELGGGIPISGQPTWNVHAVSADGSRVVFTSNGQIYDRLNGTTTVEVSASQRTPAEPGSSGAGYLETSVDGSHVLFISDGALTNNAVNGSRGSLYDYDVESGRLTDLTAANEGLEFIPYSVTRVTPDGAYIAFESEASLTGYDNTVSGGGSCGLSRGGAGEQLGPKCTEVFLYDVAANRLICASCNPSGARPIGPSSLNGSTGNAGSAWPYRPHNLSADGSRLFFTSRDALLPGATNGLYNVYEWEAEGSGGCQSSADNSGCLYLISDGSGTSNSYFADASESGNDVFFETGTSLVGQDQDSLVDLYDARVGGGFASQGTPVVAPACTSLEGCRSPLSEPPAQLSVASAELHDSGNLLTPPEAPEEKHEKKHQKKPQKKRHKKKQKKHQKKHRAANNHRRAGR
jgi:hypothetical protein